MRFFDSQQCEEDGALHRCGSTLRLCVLLISCLSAHNIMASGSSNCVVSMGLSSFCSARAPFQHLLFFSHLVLVVLLNNALYLFLGDNETNSRPFASPIYQQWLFYTVDHWVQAKSHFGAIVSIHYA